jgi:hypothetical protein
MTEILTQLGIENVTAALGAIMAFIGVCAFLTSLVTEALKGIRTVDALPAKLVCYVVAAVLTTPVFLALMAFLKQPVEWFMVFASFLASFVVAKVAMNGWDDVKELAEKMLGK